MATSNNTRPTNRRDFLTAGLATAGAIVIPTAAIILPRTAKAQGPIALGSAPGVVGAHLNLTNQLLATRSYTLGQLQAAIANGYASMGEIGALGLNAILAQCLTTAAYNSPSIVGFNSGNWEYAASLMGYQYAHGMFDMHPIIQPAPASIQVINSASAFMSLQNRMLNYLNILTSVIAENRSPDTGLREVDLGPCGTSPVDNNMLATAGVFAGAGAAFVGAGLAAPTILGTALAATITATLLLSTGVVLAGVAVAIAGYYAYTYVKARGRQCKQISLPGDLAWGGLMA